MPTFVDFAGMNTLILSTGSFDENNIIESQVNPEFSLTNSEDELVGINLHRNGPYGYSTWKQLRTSENPITRHHKSNSTMTYVVEPGPIRNTTDSLILRVRDRKSAIKRYTEPAIAQKSYPLIWSVGKHVRDNSGTIDFDKPTKFSIMASIACDEIGFANDQVDKDLKYNPLENKLDYENILKMYIDGGLNDQSSPITHWEFLQYRETVFPHMKNQFQNENLERPNFVSFYRHNREDRTKLYLTGAFGQTITDGSNISQSSWPLDPEQDFLTRTFTTSTDSIHFSTKPKILRFGEGLLMNSYHQFTSERYNDINSSNVGNANIAAGRYDQRMSPGPLYMRRISLNNTASVSNPSGMIIPETASVGTNKLFQGGALWEAGRTRQVKDQEGNWISSPRQPSYDSYEAYIEEARRRHKNFSIVSEFRMSTQVEDYVKNPGTIEIDMFDVTGGASNAQNSSQSDFFDIYSNSDFMRKFELINNDHKGFADDKVLSLRCKAVKKFLPYDGFYPSQRTTALAQRFYDSYKNNIGLFNGSGIQLNNFNYGKQMVMSPLFAPGILFNTIKSGVAVDYPIVTSSLNVTSGYGNEFVIDQDFDLRIPFEALVDPGSFLKSDTFTSNEPHPSGNLSASAFWDGGGDPFYTMMANNFFAEVPEFFLPGGNLTSLVSKKQGEGFFLKEGETYGMRIFMKKTYDNPRKKVYHYNQESLSYTPPQDLILTGSDSYRENFTMYSRPSAFGPPSLGYNTQAGTGDFFHFDDGSRMDDLGGGVLKTFVRDSRHGFNYPFTPPYYHGEAWCDVWLTGSGLMTIKQIQNSLTQSQTRFDRSFIMSNGISNSELSLSAGPQRIFDDKINKNAVQLTSSLNIFFTSRTDVDTEGATGGNINLVVDTSLDDQSRWTIQTKFETPMLNFNHISSDSDTLSIPVYGSESVPRGMWHQYGRIPEEEEGVFIGVRPIETNWQKQVMGRSEPMKNLASELGFTGKATKIGRIRESKKIHEAVVAVPFLELEGTRKFFQLNPQLIDQLKISNLTPEEFYNQQIGTVPPDQMIGKSVVEQISAMEKYIFPPSFDFMNYENVDPIAMYIFEFSHTLSQQDLVDIWQNISPDIGVTMETSEVAITHPLLKKELLGHGGGMNGNLRNEMPDKLKWMVFKVKQRASSNYFKKTVKQNQFLNTNIQSSNSSTDEFGDTSKIQYNWPYDYFSLVELIKIDSEVEFTNFNEELLSNYTSTPPTPDPLIASEDTINNINLGVKDVVGITSTPFQPGTVQTATDVLTDLVEESMQVCPDIRAEFERKRIREYKDTSIFQSESKRQDKALKRTMIYMVTVFDLEDLKRCLSNLNWDAAYDGRFTRDENPRL